jgi:flagellar motor protein MotB
MAEHKEEGHGKGGGDAHGGGDANGHGGKKKHKKHHGGGHGGGHEEGHEGAPEWLISFADMVMLMMGFFVIMFAMNIQPKGGNAGGGGEQSDGVAAQPDMIDFAIAVRKAFHNDVDVTSNDPRDQLLIQRILASQHGGAGESKDEGTKGKDQNVQSVRQSDHFGRGTSVLFAPRTASVSEAAGKTLAELAKQLRGQATVIEVRGHVGVSEAYGDPEAAMTLASDRALAAARRLAAGGIDWWRLRVVAAGSGERVEPNPDDAAADAKNARVEVRVLDEIASPRENTKRSVEGVAGTGTLGAPEGGKDRAAPAAGSGDKTDGAQPGSAEKKEDAPAATGADKSASNQRTPAKGAESGASRSAPASGARSSASGESRPASRPADAVATPAGQRGAGAAGGARTP